MTVLSKYLLMTHVCNEVTALLGYNKWSYISLYNKSQNYADTLINSLHIYINTTLITLTANLNFTSTYTTLVSNHIVSCRLSLSHSFSSNFIIMSLLNNISFINLWSASSSYTTTSTNHLVSEQTHMCLHNLLNIISTRECINSGMDYWTGILEWTHFWVV